MIQFCSYNMMFLMLKQSDTTLIKVSIEHCANNITESLFYLLKKILILVTFSFLDISSTSFFWYFLWISGFSWYLTFWYIIIGVLFSTYSPFFILFYRLFVLTISPFNIVFGLFVLVKSPFICLYFFLNHQNIFFFWHL